MMSNKLKQRGFTLIELMIAIAVVGVVAVFIYRLFDVTSQNFREVDQLASINDRIRFATERTRNYIQGAGAQSTPDSKLDERVQPPMGTARVMGIVPYDSWQNDRLAMLPEVADANPNVSFDGLVVLGAFDYALAFELSGLEPGGASRIGKIENHHRGVMKLVRQDPFLEGLQTLPTDLGLLASVMTAQGNWPTRVMRVTDRQGFQQFIQPETLTEVGTDRLEMELPGDGPPFGPKFKASGALYGLDDLPEGDTGYDAALIDAYWIHVVEDPSNPRIMSLVKDRLCASYVIEFGQTVVFNPADALPEDACGGTNDRTVLATNIADFQVWFDCADANGAVFQAPWQYQWDPTQHAGGGNCMSLATMEPGRARAGHIRIAMHADSERPDQRHVQFEDNLGAICDPDVPTDCDAARLEFATLRTFDPYPNSTGSARVVVLQTDFELVNFVNRNAL